MSVYNVEFYRAQIAESRLSANHIIPVLFQHYRPASVVDVGCGCGAWLSEFKRLGVLEVLGLDGNYVDPQQLLIDQHEFISVDLNGNFAAFLDRRFDLAVSLEVAEHLDPARATEFVASLVRMADVVLFSAALPYQGGTAHLNENWTEYWALLFRRHDFHPVDCIRPAIWGNESVCWWYRQNILVFTSRSMASRVFGVTAVDSPRPLSRVHPEFFASAYWRGRRGGGQQMWQDIRNFRELCHAYSNPEVMSPPNTVVHYRETHTVRFDGFAYRIRSFLNRFRLRCGGSGER